MVFQTSPGLVFGDYGKCMPTPSGVETLVKRCGSHMGLGIKSPVALAVWSLMPGLWRVACSMMVWEEQIFPFQKLLQKLSLPLKVKKTEKKTVEDRVKIH